ncbi:MAG: 1-acyl-sn-glycerol-3-phosphate acyltransferase [Bacteroidales bacterium]|nr:1-acyl-sn-glycerol-3-phosphate acyltransferase [Bacteroidales bacterium]
MATRFFLAVYDVLSRRRWLAWLLLLLVMGLCVWSGLRLGYKEDVTEFLPADGDGARYTDIYSAMGEQGDITVVFRATDHTLPADERYQLIEEAIDAFVDRWRLRHEGDSLDYGLRCMADESGVDEAIGFMRHNIALFLTPADYRRMDSLLSQQGYVDSCLGNVRRMLANPLGQMATEAIAADPLNLFSQPLLRLASLAGSGSHEVVDGYVFDTAGNGYAFLRSPYGSGDTRGNALLQREIDSVAEAVETNIGGVGISAVGAPLIAAANARQIKRDSFTAMALALVLIAGVLLRAVGRKRNIIWLALSVAAGWLFALGLIALLRPEISLIVIGIGSVLVGIAVNYPLHFIDHLREHPDRRETLRDMVEPLLTGNITTVSAFACLVFVKAEAMHDLGLFGALMLVGTILFVLVYLPLVAKGGDGRKGRGELDAEAGGSDNTLWHRMASRRWLRVALLCVVALLTVLLGIRSGNTSFDSDLHNINYMTAQQREDLSLLSHSMESGGDTRVVYVVNEGGTLDEALAKAQSQPRVEGVALSGLPSLLPSVAQQEERLRLWEAFIDRHPGLDKEVMQKSAHHGFTSNAFSPFCSTVQAAYKVVDPADMCELAKLCSNYILDIDGKVAVVEPLRRPEAEADEFKESMRQASPEGGSCVFDIGDTGSSLVKALSDDFNYILYVCGFVVFFFLWLSMGCIELALLSFAPLTVGWLWILGLMDLAGVKFNIVNIILATFIFGQGDDYTIFITEGLMYEYATGRKRLKSYRRSVLLSAVLMFIGIGVLVFAKHPAMRSLGEVAVIGMATVILMACYLPPLLFRWLTQKHGRRRDVPLTLGRLVRTGGTLLVFAVVALLVSLLTPLYRLCGRNTERKRLAFHGMIASMCRLGMRCLPGVGVHVNNGVGERFDKPAVIVANHESHLDLLCLLSLTPKMVVVTNDWVWRDPLYGSIIRYAEYYPASAGYEQNEARFKSLVERGYSVLIFPEGTRTRDGKLGRFHRGAFQLAQNLGVDLLPVYLHGAFHVMPPNDIVLRKGFIDITIGERIHCDAYPDASPVQLAGAVRRQFEECLAELRSMLEYEGYFLPLVKAQYLYKGREVQRRCRKALYEWRAVQHRADDCCHTVPVGQGEAALLEALANPDKDYEVWFDNAEDYLIASNCAAVPSNLHYRLRE